MILKYSLKKGITLNKITIQNCDKGCKAMKNAIVELGKVKYGIIGGLLFWFITRFVRRRITNEFIEYHFFLMGKNN